MELIKKWTSCLISLICGILGLAMSATTGMVTKTPLGEESIKASKVLTDSDLLTQAKQLGIESDFTWLKTVSIIMLVVSIILIIFAIVMLLKNLNVINISSKITNIISVVLSVLLLVTAILLLVATNGYASALATATSNLVTAEAGVYQPFMLVTSIVAILTTGAMAFLTRKDA